MPDDFDEVTAAVPAQEAARDKRRPKRIITELDENRKVVAIEIQYAGFSSAEPGQTEEDGAVRFTGANADVLKGRIFKAGARAEVNARMVTDQVDADGDDAPEEANI